MLVQKTTSPTLEQACESFLSDWTSANDRGKREYRNLLWNQVLSEFGAKTPVEHFSWEYRHSGGKTTRELMTEYLRRVFAKAPSSAKKQLSLGSFAKDQDIFCHYFWINSPACRLVIYLTTRNSARRYGSNSKRKFLLSLFVSAVTITFEDVPQILVIWSYFAFNEIH